MSLIFNYEEFSKITPTFLFDFAKNENEKTAKDQKLS